MTSSCAIWDFRRQIDGAKSTSRFGSRDGASEWPCQVWTPASSRLTCNCLLTATIRAKDLARRGRLARAPSAVLPVLKCGVHLGCFSRIAVLQHQRDLVDEPSAVEQFKHDVFGGQFRERIGKRGQSDFQFLVHSAAINSRCAAAARDRTPCWGSSRVARRSQPTSQPHRVETRPYRWPGDEVWVEDPGYPLTHAQLLLAKVRPHAI